MPIEFAVVAGTDVLNVTFVLSAISPTPVTELSSTLDHKVKMPAIENDRRRRPAPGKSVLFTRPQLGCDRTMLVV